MIKFNRGDRVLVNALTYDERDIGRLGTIKQQHDNDYDGYWYMVLLDDNDYAQLMNENELDHIDENPHPISNT